MIKKAFVEFNEDMPPAVIEWSDEEDKYFVNIPDGISMCELDDLITELKLITNWHD